jgi:class 3 adenylate cyclase/tetratricopeptide (TPR) repeat protein
VIESELPAINLAILHQGDSLCLSVTDSRSVGRVAILAIEQAALDDLLQETAWLREPAPASLRGFGRRLWDALVPDAIRAFLVRSPPRDLVLQLSATLLPIPWEAAFDGTAFLGEKFRVCRQIVSDEEVPPRQAQPPGNGTARVLLAGPGGSQPNSAAADLLRRLQAVDGLSVTRLDTAEVDRDRALALIAECDVLHYIGPVAAARPADGEPLWWPPPASVSLRDIAALPEPPRLLICENSDGSRLAAGYAATAAAACRCALDLLVCDSGGGSPGSARLIGDLYAGIAGGATIAEALRQARGAALRRGGSEDAAAAASATLYGDPRLALVSGRRFHDEDTLRQLTIMSFDLVDSTRLVGTLGAERYSEVIAAYLQRCAAVVGRFGGRSNDPQGNDGMMCYFGFPTAREDSAAQALRAALALVDDVRELGLAVRVGVATGRVVVKDGQPFGPPLHLAARLQAIAEPGAIVVGDATRQLVRERFEFETIEQLPPLKGFDHPGPAHRLLGEAQPGGRSASDTAARLTPFTGRSRELQLLEAHWAAAGAGEVRIVRVRGDAGIGKSRLAREFRRRLQARGRRAFECRCAPEHATSALYPFIDLLRRLLRIRSDDAVDGRLDRIERLVGESVGVEGAPALMAALLSVPFEARYPRPEATAERQRQLTLEVLAALLRRQTRRAPACLIVEDINWIDPSSKELLDRLVEAGDEPLLILLTQRSETADAWTPAAPVHDIDLAGLTPELARLLVRGASGEATLPAEVVRQIAARTDGVPLFIEESTRMVVDVGGSSSGPVVELPSDVPATLQDLLMARLDRLGPARLVAQVGGTIGREFPLPLLRAVLADPGSPIHAPDLETALVALAGSGLLIEIDQPPNTRLLFKHALVRDAAYQSLLERDRRRLHHVIADVLSKQFAELAATQPELLAHHYTQAEMLGDAVAGWEKAARLAASRSSQYEAISHLGQGLAIVERLPAGPERDRTELRLQLLLAGRLIATEGYGAERVEQVYARALELCRRSGDAASLVKVQLGLEGFHFMRGNFAQALGYAQQAAQSADPMHRLQSAWSIANILFHQGDHAAAVRQVDAYLAEYDKLQHRPGAVQDPIVISMCYAAWGLWETGYPDQALRRVEAAVALAERLGHRFSIGLGYGFRTTIHYFRGEVDPGLDCARRAIEICEDGGFAVWLAHARVMRGRLAVARGDASGIDEMRDGYEMWAGTGAVVTRAFYLALRAEALALLGRPDDGLALLEQALQLVRRYGERYYEAEVRRLYGELTLQQAAAAGRDRNHEAESWFLGGLERAQSLELRALALRCALSLARLWRSEGRPAEAQRILAPVFSRFGEGLDTGDLKEARALLSTLNEPAPG